MRAPSRDADLCCVTSVLTAGAEPATVHFLLEEFPINVPEASVGHP